MQLRKVGTLVTSNMGAKDMRRAGMPLIIVVLMESCMGVITTVHANSWHLVMMY